MIVESSLNLSKLNIISKTSPNYKKIPPSKMIVMPGSKQDLAPTSEFLAVPIQPFKHAAILKLMNDG